MLFSDIEGSTALLMRMGPAYADALDAQRSVLREAWAAQSGAEVGTEGDSFFVVFASARQAVAAAAAGQQSLSTYEWPGGEMVRVRMGIHTGNPTLHDGGYVGIDVHRAARIAGAAHGGQVVVSEATSRLVEDDPPPAVELRDLGYHQLRDIPRPEHLFQLVVDGLQADFPPLKTIGAASNLPTPPTPLVGREEELNSLSWSIAAGEMRLVTLTGPGGCGKTRLAIEVAHRLVRAFPDGVYLVPLSTVTSADVLWTTIAEVLDLRPRDRVSTKVIAHLKHRRALLLLDNLEQLYGADQVVAELLSQAPQLAIIGTSRSPLHVPAEYEHLLAPLDLPADETLQAALQSPAVQLFVQLARKVRSTFVLTAANAGDVVALCRRLDGLPLALELAAARTKLLSAHALLGRLDSALDIPAVGAAGPDRQRTLRDTIAWSEKLLTPDLQEFFHQLGVFSGGADLAAIAAVTQSVATSDLHDLDLLTHLVDASLLTVDETADGEPRFDMLQTVGIYARDQLVLSGRYDVVRERHAQHYLGVARELIPLLYGERRLQARGRFDLEHDNFRAALRWALPDGPANTPPPEAVRTGRLLCLSLNGLWAAGGYLFEAKRWLERAVQHAPGEQSSELAQCLALLGRKLRSLAEPARALDVTARALEMARRLPDPRSATLAALTTLSALERDRGRPDDARPMCQEAIDIARDLGDRVALQGVLVDLSSLESSEGNYERSLELGTEAVALARELGHTVGTLIARHNMAWTLLEMGRADEAREEIRYVLRRALELDEESMLRPAALDYAVVLAELGDHETAVRLLGSTDAAYRRLGRPPDPLQQDDRLSLIASTKAALTRVEWSDAYADGGAVPIEDALIEAVGTEDEAPALPA